MNVTGPQDHPVSPDIWGEPEMKRALADRDVTSVYRLLRRVGISQKQIAALTGQSQSEVLEILKGRQVMAYDVLARISDGLGIPRGYMGLAYDEATATSVVGPPVVGPPDDALGEKDQSLSPVFPGLRPSKPSPQLSEILGAAADLQTESDESDTVVDTSSDVVTAGIDQHSGVVSDLESFEDRLGITNEVRSIARMLAALHTTPPLSIALLGDWGSGKSSFMCQVINWVNALATASKSDPRGSAYAANIRQVRFNAWHYSDDHLWVGLIEHLFRELADHKGDRRDDHQDNVLAELASEQSKLHKLNENLRVVDTVDVESTWLGWVYHPFRLTRVLKIVGGDIHNEIRAPRRLLLGLGLILLGTGLVVGFTWLGQSIFVWVAGVIAVVSGLLSPASLAWRQMETLTTKARKKLQREKKQSEDRIRTLEAELDLIDPSRRLANLLSEISSADRYERYRGLTGRIRHDLDRLSTDLATAHEVWTNSDQRTPVPLQRIILYVDDLDRCTAHRVVEVLQAVNLLLSMPLFVVVVAVDPRWLLLALEEHHGSLLTAARHTRYTDRRARSLDYLDKIFHISYAVRPMGERGTEYLRSLLSPVMAGGPDLAVDPEDDTDISPLQNGTVELEESFDTKDTVATPGVVDPTEATGAPSAAEREAEVIDVRGQRLQLWKAERDFLPALAPLLSTPRAVKKLTNLYRLARIAIPEDELAEFVGREDGGPYQAVALLLAAVVSAPAQAESLILALGSTNADTGHDIVDILQDLNDPPVAALLAERIRLIRKRLPVHGEIKSYRAAAATVARYSFETYYLFSGTDPIDGRVENSSN